MPLAIASRMLRGESGSAARAASSRSCRLRLRPRARTTAFAPLPSWPASPSISPLRSCSVTGWDSPGAITFSQPEHGLAARACRAPGTSGRAGGRADARSVRRCSSDFTSTGSKLAPLRKMVTRSASLEHLAEPVGDVDDRPAFPRQRAHDRHDLFDLDVGQRRGRLVEDEDAGIRATAGARSRRAAAGRPKAARRASSGRYRRARPDRDRAGRAAPAGAPSRSATLLPPRQMFSATESAEMMLSSCVT